MEPRIESTWRPQSNQGLVMQERMGDSNIACAPTGIDSFEIVGVTKLETLVSVALPLLIMGRNDRQ